MLDTERYQVIENFDMPQLGRSRTLRVYLPNNYFNSCQSYPVIYMHDGQNLFDASISYGGDTWRLAENIDQYFDEPDGVIVVGIDNGAEFGSLCRMFEYSPWKMATEFDLPAWDPLVYQSGGDGDKYLEFITETLKPFIDKKYRTKPERESTAIAGSSMGGFISLYAVMARPDLFSMAGVFSPAFWFNQKAMFSYLESRVLEHPVNIYMDMGTEESSDSAIEFEKIYLNGSNHAHSILQGKPHVSIKYLVEQGAKHTESAWARRFPNMLELFF